MKILLDPVITDLDDQDIILDNAPLTLRRVIQFAMIAQLPGDQELSGDNKLKAFNIAIDARAESLELTAESIVFVKTRIARAYGPLVVGRTFALLEKEA